MHLAGRENSEGLFQRVILQSGVSTTLPLRDLDSDDYSQKVFDLLVQDAGCSNYRNQVQCLRQTDPMFLIDAAEARNFTFVWGPMRDGVFLSSHPQDWVRNGDFAQVPTIVGNMKDDGSFLSFDMKVSSREDFDDFINDSFPAANTSAHVKSLYPPEDYGNSPYWAISAIATDAVFLCPARQLSRSTVKAPIWRYRIDKEFFIANMIINLKYKRASKV